MAVLSNHPVSRDQAKVMNRYDITKRLIGLLHRDEAVIGYINFDLWGHPSRLTAGGSRISTC